MSSRGDLWDDSILINAFNDAIFNYKKMHNMEQIISSGDAEKAISFKENPSDVDNAQDAERHAGTNDESEIVLNSKSEVGDTGNKPTVKETSLLESEAPEDHFNSSNGQDLPHEPTFHQNSQGSEDYNQLLNKYYEIEDQRQKILQQLNQIGYGNYSFDYGTTTAEQHHQTSAPQAHWGLTGSVCPYGCQSWVTCCPSEPSSCCNKADATNSCYAPVEAACSKDSVSRNENDIVKTAQAAAERALSSFKEQVSNNSDVCINQGQEDQLEKHAGELAKSTSSETDFTLVLNAWYSAGFYTGKYLSEQSLAKNRRS